MSTDTMLIVELMEWIEGRQAYSAWELAESLIETGWVTRRDAEVAAKAYERAILDVGLNPDLANQLLDTNPYRKAVQS